MAEMILLQKKELYVSESLHAFRGFLYNLYKDLQKFVICKKPNLKLFLFKICLWKITA